MVHVFTTIDSPEGELTLVARAGALTGVYMEQHRHMPARETFGERDDRPFGDAIRQLEEYFAGERREFDLRLDLGGTPFQQTVWRALTTIPYGTTVTYGELARQ